MELEPEIDHVGDLPLGTAELFDLENWMKGLDLGTFVLGVVGDLGELLLLLVEHVLALDLGVYWDACAGVVKDCLHGVRGLDHFVE